jgi:hypothetical protein
MRNVKIQDLTLIPQSSGFVADAAHDVDLQTAPYGYREFVMWHGAQFRGLLADQKYYWRTFLTNIGITPR